MRFKKLHTTFLIIVVALNAINAQLVSPLSDEMNRLVEHKMIKTQRPIFTVWKPWYDNQLLGTARQDSFSIEPSTRRKTWFGRKLLQESFVQIDSSGYYLFADPLFNLSTGQESGNNKTFINTRGFRAGGRLGNNFAFGTSFYENQAHFTKALNEYVDSFNVVPGQGRVHWENVYGWDYANSSGYISYSPVHQINIQLGQGKTFIGDGQRSLLYSDFSNSYPYVRLTWQNDYFMYSWMVNQLIDYNLKRLDNQLPFRHLNSGVKVLSANILKKIQLSVIQEELYYHTDTMENFKLSTGLLNPIITPRSVRNDMHPVWGTNLKINLFHEFYIYNQILLDKLGGSGKLKKGIQLGLKYFDVFGIENLYLQGEYNKVEAGAYLGNVRQLNWKHYNEPLAHPYGSNFEEYSGIASYRYKRMQLSARCNYTQSLNKIENEAELVKNGSFFWRNSRFLLNRNFQFTFILNPKTLAGISIGCNLRNETYKGLSTTSTYIYGALSTSLSNTWFDL